MTWTVTKTSTVMGNMRCVIVNALADAATQNIETGLTRILGCAVNYKSCATGPNFIYDNSAVSGTQIFGTLGCSGFTSGDQICAIVFGV